MKKAIEARKKKVEKENKAQKKAEKEPGYVYQKISNKQQSKSDRNIQKDIIGPTNGLEASNDTVSDFPKSETFNNGVPDFSRPDSSSSNLKSLFGANVRLDNS